MKVLLVEHPRKLWPLFGKGKVQPLHLACLASVLEENGIDVEVLDCTALDYGWKEYKEAIMRIGPDIVGVSGLTPFRALAIKTMSIAKEVSQDIVTVAGGEDFTFAAEECLEAYNEIDYIVLGEGEITFLELVRALGNGWDINRVSGIALRHEGRVVRTTPRPLIENLDSLPFPAYHKLPMSKYSFIVWGSDICVITSSRGCSFNCRFCTEWKFWGRRWRTRSAKKIADEMELLNKEFGVSIIWFGDDNFSLSRERNEQLVEELERRKLDMRWYMEARVDDMARDIDLIPRMAKAGLFHMLLGVESYCQEDLDYHRKGTTVEQVEPVVRSLKQHGVIAHAQFIVGLPHHTRESIQETVDFAKRLNPDLAMFIPMTPLPGTDFYEEAMQEGLVEESELAKFNFIEPVARTRFLSRDELRRQLRMAHARFYLRPSKIIGTHFSRNKMRRITARYVAKFMFRQFMEDFLPFRKPSIERFKPDVK